MFIWFGAALVTSARLRRIRVGDSDSIRTKSVEGVVFPGSWTTWVLRYLEIRQLTPPHAVEILATTVRQGTRELSNLSESHDLNSGCSVGDDSTAPPSGRLSPPNPGPQQYLLKCWSCLWPVDCYFSSFGYPTTIKSSKSGEIKRLMLLAVP